MKRNLLLLAFSAIIFSACSNMKKLQSYDDDAYLDPHRDKNIMYPVKVEEPVNTEPVATNQKMAATAADGANPYYKDKDFNYDDYYDNEYAARIKRFHTPMNGVGYYDTYYTNSYFYNQNPYQYGVSIYNGYNFWPSYNNYSYVPNYNWGGYYGYGSCYNYNPYSYNSFYNPYYGVYVGPSYGFGLSCGNGFGSPYYGGYGYNPYGYGYGGGYGMGYNNGFYNGFNSGYYSAYNNQYDYNSNIYYGPRTSHSGASNDHESINASGSKMQVQKPLGTDYTANSPTSMERFNQVKYTSEAQQVMHKGNAGNEIQGRPNNNSYSGSYGNNTSGGNDAIKNNNFNNGSNTNSTPKGQLGNGSSEPKKGRSNWGWSSGDNSSGGNNNSSDPGRPMNHGGNTNNSSEPSKGSWNSGGGFQKSGGFSEPSRGGSNSGGSSSGHGGFRPR